MITKIAEILGVSEESIKTMPKDIFGSMQAVLANIEVRMKMMQKCSMLNLTATGLREMCFSV